MGKQGKEPKKSDETIRRQTAIRNNESIGET